MRMARLVIKTAARHQEDGAGVVYRSQSRRPRLRLLIWQRNALGGPIDVHKNFEGFELRLAKVPNLAAEKPVSKCVRTFQVIG
jgi:hypothetical protein